MLGAVVVQLQRQARARLDHDALDLEAIAMLDGVIEAPGPAHLAVRVGLRRVQDLHARDHILDVLHVRAIHHQHRVGGLHHHDVAGPDARHQAPVGMDIAGMRAFEHHAAAPGVAFGVLVHGIPHGVPRAQVRPARLQRHHHAPAR